MSDITYIHTNEGWLYLTIILDLGDRKVIGWALSDSLKASNTVIPAWKMAIKNRPICKALLFHSDRGVQYACDEFLFHLKANKKVTQSMSRKGNCWDNAVAESFFKTLKVECSGCSIDGWCADSCCRRGGAPERAAFFQRGNLIAPRSGPVLTGFFSPAQVRDQFL